MQTPRGSIVIAAHDEEAVIARALSQFSDIVQRELVDVIVVCNGCRDRTAEVARRFPGVRVRELTRPSKALALRDGDRHAAPGPRIYLDADVVMTERAALATLSALSHGALAGRPPHQFDSTGASWLVRRWYAVRTQIPSIAESLWGAGCYALSEEAQSRFDEFPDLVADDLFIDQLFTPQEVTIIDTDPVIVRTPRHVPDLLKILRRSYRTQNEVGPPPAGRLSAAQRDHLRDLVLVMRRGPLHTLDVVVYLAVVVVARLRAACGPAPRWERDDSSRSQSQEQ